VGESMHLFAHPRSSTCLLASLLGVALWSAAPNIGRADQKVLGTKIVYTPLRNLMHRGGGMLIQTWLPLRDLGERGRTKFWFTPETLVASDAFASAASPWMIHRSLLGARVGYGDRLRVSAASHAGFARIGPNVPFEPPRARRLSFDASTSLELMLARGAELGLFVTYSHVMPELGLEVLHLHALAANGAPRREFAWLTAGVMLYGRL
jgi:hypothetical protein